MEAFEGDGLAVASVGLRGSGDADSAEEEREEDAEEERLEEHDEPELLLPLLPLLLPELLLRSRLLRHADCDPLSRKGQSALSRPPRAKSLLPETAAVAVADAAAATSPFFNTTLFPTPPTKKKNYYQFN